MRCQLYYIIYIQRQLCTTFNYINSIITTQHSFSFKLNIKPNVMQLKKVRCISTMPGAWSYFTLYYKPEQSGVLKYNKNSTMWSKQDAIKRTGQSAVSAVSSVHRHQNTWCTVKMISCFRIYRIASNVTVFSAHLFSCDTTSSRTVCAQQGTCGVKRWSVHPAEHIDRKRRWVYVFELGLVQFHESSRPLLDPHIHSQLLLLNLIYLFF